MDLKNILFMRAPGKPMPGAALEEDLWAKKLFGSYEKSIDFSPVISVSDALAKPALELITKITAFQAGSGDPSPVNIRDISGWSDGKIVHAKGILNDTVIPIAPIQAGSGDPSPINIRPISAGLELEMDDHSVLYVYGGNLDPITGVLTATHTISIIDENMDGGVASIGGVWFANGVNNSNILTGYCGLTACNAYKLHSGLANTSAVKTNLALYEFCGCTLSGNKTRIFFRDERFETSEELREWLAENPVYVVQELAEPITYNLSQTELARALTALETMVYPVSWPEAGIVYGATRNVTTGEMLVNYVAQTFDGTEEGWRAISLGTGYYITISGSDYTRSELLKCSCLIGTNSSSSAGMPLNSIMLNGSKTNLLCRVDITTDFPSVDDWKDFLTRNPMTVLFPLAEPIVYSFDPIEVPLLAGDNTIWSTTGDVSLKYLAKR